MRDQIIEVSGQCPTLPWATGPNENTKAASYPDAAFWLQAYPPLSDWKAPLPHSRVVCPWSLAAELADDITPDARRRNILDALKTGLRTIRQYDLPAARIMFAEHHATRVISVWVD